MGIHITMNKEFEDAEIVVYQYYPSESPEKVGKMYFHKKEEMFYDLEPVPEESIGTRNHYFNCAISRIVICLRNGGEFLEEMTYGV
ncbi:hypothetical protein A6279_07345 [Bacillus wiedmannii]|uniref:Uncharacterized protein n=1 Tax=Bacillus cereus group sp. MS39 TaxID=3041344 RepID=A0AAU8F331_9BACI|nr:MULTISPECIES: hypothetical protein [Bacillus cereus group]EJQ46515.1 hypothetical protein IEI_04109 [Bacillus wiedmannii]KAA0777760.1 hypothetical protein DN392_07120 [Bacillus sp. BB51/4]MCT6915275.1 hypothetical protein [Bacillus wiedmannii]MED2837666.1 hypothetical protein [Bacillus wiedmannii]OAK04283.1 hypothetical protein A6279_07345 [Bacillus wiedmannii]